MIVLLALGALMLDSIYLDVFNGGEVQEYDEVIR